MRDAIKPAKEVIASAIGEWFSADGLIEILSEAGYVIVPKEPTYAMIEAAERVVYAGESHGEDCNLNIDSHVAELAYLAMISASR